MRRSIGPTFRAQMSGLQNLSRTGQAVRICGSHTKMVLPACPTANPHVCNPTRRDNGAFSTRILCPASEQPRRIYHLSMLDSTWLQRERLLDLEELYCLTAVTRRASFVRVVLKFLLESAVEHGSTWCGIRDADWSLSWFVLVMICNKAY